jgi:hypothetical protein
MFNPVYGPESAWTDEFHIFVKALQDTPHAEEAKPQRVVLADVREWPRKELTPSGRFACMTDGHTLQHLTINLQ